MMHMRKLILLSFICTLLLGVSCNKQSGCPASQAPKMVNTSDEKQASFGGKKAKKAPKSSVIPAEIRMSKKKK